MAQDGVSNNHSLALVSVPSGPSQPPHPLTQENHLVDALPYFDKGYDEPGVQQAAMALVTEEMRRYRPTKNYLEYLGDSLQAHPGQQFETEIMRAEFERLTARQPMDLLSMKRYELPGPPTGKMTDVKAWQEAVNNAQAQMEHQMCRIQNLELASEYGTLAWKNYNGILEKMLLKAEVELHDIKRKIQEINWNRKKEQTDAGERLQTLEETWVGLVAKNYDIERANMELEQEIRHLREQLPPEQIEIGADDPVM